MNPLFLEISLIVVSCAVLAWLASLARQPIVIGYLLCGILAGPSVLGLISRVELIEPASHIGVTLLLFLAGLVLHPNRLVKLFRETLLVTLGAAAVSFILTLAFLLAWGYRGGESAFAAAALMFSSTILVVKLLPTTTLHQRHMGSVCIAILIAQDLIAVLLILVIAAEPRASMLAAVGLTLLKTLALAGFAAAFEQFALRRMMRAADRYPEVLEMLCIAWCLGISAAALSAGLPSEIGAFIGGVAMARTRIADFLSEKLKPLRDFFLLFFFFILGADLNMLMLAKSWLPGLILAALILISRPVLYAFLFRVTGEASSFSREVGLRLGQASEFSMLAAVIAGEKGSMGEPVSQLVQFAAIVTFIASSYAVVARVPTPIGTKTELKRD